ncbi:MAG: hypothetical protein R2741_08610 [Methanolobus sp.]
MKYILHILLLLIIFTILFSGITKISEEEKQFTVETIAHGAEIRNVNGILFDENDQLYLTSVFGGEIVVVDPESGEVIRKLGAESGVKCPDDLIFGPDGSLYHTDLAVGEVGRLTPDNLSTTQFIAFGTNSITFSDDGRLFVALDFMGDGLYELDPELSAEPRLIASDPGWVNAMDWGPDGYLYGPVWTKEKVIRVDVDSGEITTVADGFDVPVAVKFDSKGNLYVADHLGTIYRIDMNNNTQEKIANGLEIIDNIAFDSSDRLYASAQDGSVYEILDDGTRRAVIKGGMIGPGGVAIVSSSGQDSIYIADLSYLRELDGESGEQLSVERHIMGDLILYNGSGSITAPTSLSYDGENLIISSWLYNIVQVWDPVENKLVEEYFDISVPIDALRFQGDIIVTELGMEEGMARVIRINDSGRSTLAGGLAVPAGLAATENDLWVSDWYTGMILQLAKDGDALPEPIPIASNLSYPEGMAVDTDGNLLVVETGTGTLSKIDIETGEISTIADNLEVGAPMVPGMVPTYILSGVDVSSSGTIYVTGDVSNVLYRIKPAG